MLKHVLLFVLVLLIQYGKSQSQLPWKVTDTFSDTITLGDTYLFETSSATRDNGPPPSFCSPLVSQTDTLRSNTLFYDIVFDVTPPWINGCTRLDTFGYTFSQTGYYTLVCYWSSVDSLSPNPNAIRFHSDTVNIYVQANSTGLQELKRNSINFYPNPVKHVLKLENIDRKIQTFEIWDLKGRLLQTFEGSNEQLDVEQLPNGVYLLRAIGEEGSWQQKFVKQ